MIESIEDPFRAKKKPWEMFFIAILYYSVGCLLSIWVFPEYASMVSLLFTVMASVPLIYNIMKVEETDAVEDKFYSQVLMGHGKYFFHIMMFFSGLVVASTIWYILSPSHITSILFESQMRTFSGISGNVSQNFGSFVRIFFNNMKVLVFCILFSLVYGSGAIFILSWNASIIGVAIGNFVRVKIALMSNLSGFAYFGKYFAIFSIGLTRYVIHGIPEILAYFVGGLAGSLISVAIVNKQYKDEGFSKVLFDVSVLLLIAILITLISAILEVYITPLLFNVNVLSLQ